MPVAPSYRSKGIAPPSKLSFGEVVSFVQHKKPQRSSSFSSNEEFSHADL